MASSRHAWHAHASPSHPLQAPAGANYRLSLKLRAPTSAGLPVQLQLRQTGAPYIAYGQALTAVGAGWATLEIAFARVPTTAANPGSSNAPIFFVVVSGGPGTLWLAEPVLQALPAGGAAPVVQLAPPAGAVPRAFFCLNTNHVFETGVSEYLPVRVLGKLPLWPRFFAQGLIPRGKAALTLQARAVLPARVAPIRHCCIYVRPQMQPPS